AAEGASTPLPSHQTKGGTGGFGPEVLGPHRLWWTWRATASPSAGAANPETRTSPRAPPPLRLQPLRPSAICRRNSACSVPARALLLAAIIQRPADGLPTVLPP